MALTGQYWPYHPKPLPDELFSSWLVRIARGNTAKVHTFCNYNWPDTQIWTRDIDKYGFARLLDVLVTRCGVSREAAISTTLEAYTGKVYERLSWKTHTRWIMPVGIFHRTRLRPGLQWCPCCLASDKVPYFRKHWRLAFSSCCTRHGVLLIDRCPYCKAPAAAHRGYQLSSCGTCGTSLADAEEIPASSRALQLEAQLMSNAASGAGTLGIYGMVHGIAYFDILYRLMSLLAFGRRSDALRQSIVAQYGGDPRPVEALGRNRLVEYLSPEHRNRLLDLIAPIMPGWPFRFIGVCIDSRNWASWVLKDMKPIRFHLWDPCRTYLAGPLVVPPEQL